MKKRFKLTFIVSIFALITFIVGCSVEEKKEMYVSKTIDNINIKINDISSSENAKGNKNMVEVKFTIINKGSGETGIGANDFKIKIDRKEYTVYPQGNNFGDVIQPEEKLSGSAFFELPKSAKEGELFYEINQKEKATWELKIPASK